MSLPFLHRGLYPHPYSLVNNTETHRTTIFNLTSKGRQEFFIINIVIIFKPTAASQGLQ